MSLVGNLEDLGLGDILQIVSLSRKSGVLHLHSQNREGKIIFQNGQVNRATSSSFPENLGDLLVRKGLADIDTVKKALLLQKGAETPILIGEVLSTHFGVDKNAIEDIVREQVEKISYSFFAWSEGTFSFELGESSEVAGVTQVNPLSFRLEKGLNPQWLAMEGSRILDEKRHRGESLDETPQEESLFDLDELLGTTEVQNPISAQATSAPSGNAASVSGRGVVLFVDDDENTRNSFSRALGGLGYEVLSFSGGETFLQAVSATVEAGTNPFLIVDLFMPRMDGSGILGGLELIESVRARHQQLPILVLSDHPNDEAERRVRDFGLPPVVPKPKKSEVREAGGDEAITLLAERVALLLDDIAAGKSPTAAVDTINFGADLLREMGETTDSRAQKGPESPGLHLLRGMLQELNNPSLGGGIILLVLRFASELMNRAVIFLVKDAETVGLGQFGIVANDEMADVRVRRMKVPRGEDSVFESLFLEMSPKKVALGPGPWDRYLAEQLGGGEPKEVFLGPIISEGKVVAVLYGDNLPEMSPIGDTESLEIFLSQAGLAMEKALLERRLRGKETVV